MNSGISLLMSGSFVHKIIIAGCRCFARPLPSGPSLKRMEMRIARQPDTPLRRRNRLILGGLAMAVLLVLAVFALVTRPTNSTDGSASPATTSSKPETTTTSTSTIDTRDEVVSRFKQIFRIRDEAIRTRNPLPLEEIYTADCPCLKGDQQLIRKLRQEGLLWRGIKVSLDVQEVERVNDRLWTISAIVTTNSFEIVTEAGVVLRRIPEGRELSRFALARPIGAANWLLGRASVVEERD
jgi:hypothetical protein